MKKLEIPVVCSVASVLQDEFLHLESPISMYPLKGGILWEPEDENKKRKIREIVVDTDIDEVFGPRRIPLEAFVKWLQSLSFPREYIDETYIEFETDYESSLISMMVFYYREETDEELEKRKVNAQKLAISEAEKEEERARELYEKLRKRFEGDKK